MNYSIFWYSVMLVVFLSSCNHSNPNVKSDEPLQKRSLSFNSPMKIGGGPEGNSANTSQKPKFPNVKITQDQGLGNAPTNTPQKPEFKFGTKISQTAPKKMERYCSKRNKNTCLYIRGNTVYANRRGGMVPVNRTVSEIKNSKRSGFEFRGFGSYRIQMRQQ